MEFQAAPLDRLALVRRLGSLLPAGLFAEHLYQIPPSSPPLSALTVQVYEMGLAVLSPEERAELAERFTAFESATEWSVSRASKGEVKTYDLKARVVSSVSHGDRLEVKLKQGGFMDLVNVLCPGQEKEKLSLARLRFEFPPEA